jgi:hypothetical protein
MNEPPTEFRINVLIVAHGENSWQSHLRVFAVKAHLTVSRWVALTMLGGPDYLVRFSALLPPQA